MRMEKFAVAAGIVVAALLTLGSIFQGGAHFMNFDWHSDHEGFNFGPDVADAKPIARGAAQDYTASSLIVRNAAAVLRVIPEERADISITVTGGEALPALSVGAAGNELIIDGGLDTRSRTCGKENDVFFVQWPRSKRVVQAQMPVIVARVPMDVTLAAGWAVQSDIGPSRSADLRFSSCASQTIGPVAGRLSIQTSGSGDVVAQTAGEARVESAGSSDISLADIGGPLSVEVSGSGSTRAGNVSGNADLHLAGSGAIEVGTISGPLSAELAGSGDLTAAAASGQMEFSLAGSGDIMVHGGVAGAIEANIAGSGDIVFEGEAASVDASIAGSGDVRVKKVLGKVEQSAIGSGKVIIG